MQKIYTFKCLMEELKQINSSFKLDIVNNNQII